MTENQDSVLAAEFPLLSDQKALSLPKRPLWVVTAERAFEWIIRLSGVSAILFVLAIFFLYSGSYPCTVQRKFQHSTVPIQYQMVPDIGCKRQVRHLLSYNRQFFGNPFAMLIAVPFGLGAAIYISEFCEKRLKETLKIIIELLAAIPSVVWGFIGITVMSKLIVNFTSAPAGVNLLNGGLILALMSVPIIVSISEDALKAVPDSYREAALSMGATKWQMIYRVLIPAAKNGLLAAVLLGIGRAVGETMAVLMATGHAVQIPMSLIDSVRTLTANIAAELGEAPAGSDHYRVLFLTGVLLFCITFVVNLTADLVIRGIHRK